MEAHRCTECGALLTARDVISAGVAKCSKCGAESLVPLHDRPKTKKKREGGVTFACPKCKNECNVQDQVCTNCGLDFSTGQKVFTPISEPKPKVSDILAELKEKVQASFGKHVFPLVFELVILVWLLLIRSCCG